MYDIAVVRHDLQQRGFNCHHDNEAWPGFTSTLLYAYRAAL